MVGQMCRAAFNVKSNHFYKCEMMNDWWRGRGIRLSSVGRWLTDRLSLQLSPKGGDRLQSYPSSESTLKHTSSFRLMLRWSFYMLGSYSDNSNEGKVSPRSTLMQPSFLWFAQSCLRASKRVCAELWADVQAQVGRSSGLQEQRASPADGLCRHSSPPWGHVWSAAHRAVWETITNTMDTFRFSIRDSAFMDGTF